MSEPRFKIGDKVVAVGSTGVTAHGEICEVNISYTLRGVGVFDERALQLVPPGDPQIARPSP